MSTYREEIASASLYKRFNITPQIQPPYSFDQPEISLVIGFDNLWRNRSWQIICQVTRFLMQLKRAAESYKLRLITRRIHRIIGDNSSDYDFYALRGMVHTGNRLSVFCKSLCQKFLPSYHIRVIQPDSPFKLIFDCLLLCVIVINIFYIPMQLSFNLESEQSSTVDILFNQIPSWVFLLEIVLNFNTAYYKDGMIHDMRSQIIRHYLQGDFAKDLLVVIPFFISQYNIPYINFVLLLRMTRVSRIFEQIEEVTLLREKLAAPIDLIKLIYLLVLVAHMCGCAWHYLGVQELSEDVGWLLKYSYQDKHWIVRYQASLYFGTITAFTVGYGDIVPQTTLEQTFVTIMVLIASIVFGYTISSIMAIFNELRRQKESHRNKMAIVNSYLKKHQITPMLQMKIRKYFEHYYTMTEGPEEIMEKLNEELLSELKANIYGPKLKSCDLLNRFNEQVIQQLTRPIRIKKFIPGESIFNPGDEMNYCYFIMKGCVETFVNKKAIQLLEQGSVGLREFILQKNVLYGAKATQFTEIAVIDFTSFINIIKQHGYEEYCLLRDQLVFDNLPIQCSICSRSHNFLECPLVFYNPSRAKLVMDQRQNQAQSRQTHQRRKQKYNSLVTMRYAVEEALEMAIDNGIQDELNEEMLTRLGYNQLRDSFDNNTSNYKLETKLENIKSNSKQRHNRRSVDLSAEKAVENKQSDPKQMEVIYQEFLRFKKEESLQVDQMKQFEAYKCKDNYSQIVQGGSMTKKKREQKSNLVSRLKTFYNRK